MTIDVVSKLIRGFSKSPKLVATTIAVVFSILYFSTTPKVNVSYADSDLMTTIGYHLGVAHPPGYPMYMVLVYILTHLPIAGTVAFKAHLLSLILHAITLYFVYLSSWRLTAHYQKISLTKKPSQTKIYERFLISTISTIALGASFLFWLYSIVAEKYPLNDLFISITIFLIISISTKNKPHQVQKYIYSLALIVGLALNHHHTFLLLIPSLLLFTWYSREKIFTNLAKKLIFFSISLTTPVLILLWLNTNNSPVSWNFDQNPKGLYRMLTRRDLSGFLLIQGKSRGIYLHDISIEEIVSKIPTYILILNDHFGSVATTILVIGLIKLLRSKRKLDRIIFIAVLSTTIFIPLYVEWPQDISIQALRIRMYLAGYIPIPLIVSIGLYTLINQAQSKGYLKPSKQTFTAITLLAVFFSYIRITQTFQANNLKNFDLVSSHYKQILSDTKPNALIGCLSDVSCFAMLYSQQVEGIRPDAIILPHANKIVEKSLNKFPNLKGYNYDSNPSLFLDYLTWNLDKRPVYIVELQKIYYDVLGTQYGFTSYNTQGYFGKIELTQPANNPNYDHQFTKLLAQTETPKQDQMRLQLKASIMQKHLLNARIISLYQGSQEQINQELNLAKSLSASLPNDYQTQIQDLASQLSQIKGISTYAPGSQPLDQDDIINQANLFHLQNRPRQAYIGLQGLLNRNPLNIEARLALARLYENTQQVELAITEYQNILKYFPDQPQSIEHLSRLSNAPQ